MKTMYIFTLCVCAHVHLQAVCVCTCASTSVCVCMCVTHCTERSLTHLRLYQSLYEHSPPEGRPYGLLLSLSLYLSPPSRSLYLPNFPSHLSTSSQSTDR